MVCSLHGILYSKENEGGTAKDPPTQWISNANKKKKQNNTYTIILFIKNL